LVTLLEDAKDYIDSIQILGRCPVCEQPVKRQDLSTALETRIEAMQKIAQLTKAAKGTKKTLDEKTATAGSELKKYAEQVRTTADQLKSCTLNTVRSATFPEGLLDTLSSPEIPDADLALKAEAWMPTLAAIKQSLETNTKTSRDGIALHTAILRDLETLRKYVRQTRDFGKLCRRLQKSLEIVEEKRKAFVNHELDSISGEVDRLFQIIHPGERLGGIKLSLKEKFQHSLLLEGDFYTETGIAPQSLFSESHLDTLGLCVFLALAKKYQTEDIVIILDDVVTSVDQSHLARLIDMLHDEAAHFGHIIMTTHYGPWRDRYRSGRAPSGQVHFIELASWTLEKGIRPFKGKLRIDDLKEALAREPVDKQVVASKAGILLEDVLEFLNRTYELRLPLKNTPGYTLRELTDGFPSKFLKLLRVERITDGVQDGKATQQSTEIPLEPVVNTAKGLAAIRNQVGCHYNELGSLCTEEEVRELAAIALQLAEALACPVNGDFPSRNKSGAYWESRSGKVRLHPLQQPS
jgi:hypothetical protein